MRYPFGFLCVFALAVVPLVGCGAEGDGDGGTDAGTDGGGLCDGVECDDDNECTEDVCDPADGMCDNTAVADNTDCDFGDLPGLCMSGVCEDAMLCQGVTCEDTECKIDGVCDASDGICDYTLVADGTDCDFGDLPGLCMSGVCVGLCEGVECDDDTECRFDGTCDPYDGICDYTFAENGTSCGDGPGSCQAGSCVGGVFACSEEGIRAAIAVGGGPHTFDCDGPTTVVTEDEIRIDNDVILNGEGLTVHGDRDHRVFVVERVTAELRSFTVTAVGGMHNVGTLTLMNSVTRSGLSNGEGTLTLMNSTVTWGGLSNGEGTLTLTNSIVSGAVTGEQGGGIFNRGGTVTLTNSTVSGSYQDISGCGHICPITGGGGITNREGMVTLTNSTVSENGGRGITNTEGMVTLTNSTVSGNGGGIFNGGGTVTLTNSTVSGNINEGRDTVGGILNDGTLTLINSTVSGNTSIFGDNGLGNTEGATTTLTNSIVHGDCDDTEGTFTSNGYNIESPGDTCGFDQEGDQPNVSPDDLDLQDLADNGGPTMTHAITTDSAAFNKIPAGMCEVDTDQRGVDRPQGPTCDIGAFELEQ